MDQEVMDLFREDFSLLIESGFVAVKQFDEVSAGRIFKAAEAISPNNTAPQVGMGFIAINKLDIKEALRIFESVTQKEPENYLAQVFLGMAYLMSKGKQKKGSDIIKLVIEKAEDPDIKSLGKLSLEWGEKDLSKNTKLPFFEQKS